MAILMQSSSTSADVVRPASQSQLSMSSEAARVMRSDLPTIVLAGRADAYPPAVAGVQPADRNNSITSIDLTVACDSRLRGVVDGKGAIGSSAEHGAFVTSLGSRPPSPPV
jgi:hypothetical protein